MQTIDDPVPVQQCEGDSAPPWRIKEWVQLPRDFTTPTEDLVEVLDTRRSRRPTGQIGLIEIARLLWYSQRRISIHSGDKERGTGPTATAGGLASVRTIVVNSSRGSWLYDPVTHRACLIDVHKEHVTTVLGEAQAYFGAGKGVLILFGADRSRIERYYSNPESLVLRESGGLATTMSLVSEALDLAFCQLGTQADSWLRNLLSSDGGAVIPAGAALVGKR